MDRETVVKCIEYCTHSEDKRCETYCQYWACDGCCIDAMLEDALTLLKVQPDIVRCRDCKYRPVQTEPPKTFGFSIEFPEGSRCPCQCDDGYYSWYPADDWFCANGVKKDD